MQGLIIKVVEMETKRKEEEIQAVRDAICAIRPSLAPALPELDSDQTRKLGTSIGLKMKDFVADREQVRLCTHTTNKGKGTTNVYVQTKPYPVTEKDNAKALFVRVEALVRARDDLNEAIAMLKEEGFGVE